MKSFKTVITAPYENSQKKYDVYVVTSNSADKDIKIGISSNLDN